MPHPFLTAQFKATQWVKFLTMWVLFLFCTAGLSANDGSLLRNSPFLPPSGNVEKKEREDQSRDNGIEEQFEFRGIFEMSGDWQFSVYDKNRKSSYWVELGKTPQNHDFRVTDFDSDNARILVEWEGKTAYLDLLVYRERNKLKPRGGELVSQDFFDAPISPPDVKPPQAPPPPPLSEPPSGPPPRIPQKVLERYEKEIAKRERRDTGPLIGGVAGGSPPPPPAGLSGIPSTDNPEASRPVGAGDDGNTPEGDGGDGTTTTDGEIPGLPGGPPSSPPSITIPEIPDFPEDSG